jgi:hypothetical protein
MDTWFMDNEKLSNHIRKNMYGWWGGKGHCWLVLGAISQYCRTNHLEIGALFGATAIYTALIMEHNEVDGLVYTIDPCLFNLHEPDVCKSGTITPELVRFQPEIIQDNIKKFGVEDRVVFIQKSSHPLPYDVKGIKFDTCFIDGDHQHGTPIIDVKNCIKLGVKNIILDDTHYRYPCVMRAFKYILDLDDWDIGMVHQSTSWFKKLNVVEPPYGEVIGEHRDLTINNWPDYVLEAGIISA